MESIISDHFIGERNPISQEKFSLVRGVFFDLGLFPFLLSGRSLVREWSFFPPTRTSSFSCWWPRPPRPPRPPPPPPPPPPHAGLMLVLAAASAVRHLPSSSTRACVHSLTLFPPLYNMLSDVGHTREWAKERERLKNFSEYFNLFAKKWKEFTEFEWKKCG